MSASVPMLPNDLEHGPQNDAIQWLLQNALQSNSRILALEQRVAALEAENSLLRSRCTLSTIDIPQEVAASGVQENEAVQLVAEKLHMQDGGEMQALQVKENQEEEQVSTPNTAAPETKPPWPEVAAHNEARREADCVVDSTKDQLEWSPSCKEGENLATELQQPSQLEAESQVVSTTLVSAKSSSKSRRARRKAATKSDCDADCLEPSLESSAAASSLSKLFGTFQGTIAKSLASQ